MSLCKVKIVDSFNRNDGAHKSCNNGTAEVPFASFHRLINLVFFLAPREDTKIFRQNRVEMVLAVQNQAFTFSILILLNRYVGCGIYYYVSVLWI